MDDESFNLVATLERKYGTSYFSNEAKEEPQNKSYPIPFPLEDLRASDTLTGSLAHLMRILKVFEKIMQFNHRGPGSLDSYKSEMDIKNSLHNWNKSFKTWVVNSSLILGENPKKPFSPWMSTFLEIVYNFCIVCFHRPRLLKDFELNVGDRSKFSHASQSIIESAANAVSNVFQKFDFSYFYANAPSFTHTIIFQLGLTYGMLLFINPESPYSTRYFREIDSFTASLSRISRYFSPAEIKWNFLKNLAISLHREKTDHEQEAEIMFFREISIVGQPLIGPYVSQKVAIEYTKSRSLYLI